jgi:hypothetical protein
MAVARLWCPAVVTGLWCPAVVARDVVPAMVDGAVRQECIRLVGGSVLA